MLSVTACSVLVKVLIRTQTGMRHAITANRARVKPDLPGLYALSIYMNDGEAIRTIDRCQP